MAIPVAIPIAMMAAQLGSQLFAGAKNASAMRKFRAYLDNRINETNTYYGSKLSQDYLDTEEAKSTLSAMRDGMKRNIQSLNNSGVAKGMTDEGRVAAAGEINDRFAQGMSRIAGQGTAYKDRLRSSWRAEKQALEDQKMGAQAADAGKYAQMGSNISNAIGAGLYAYGALGGNTASNGTGQGSFDVSKAVDATSNGAAATNGVDYKPLYT